MDSNETVLMLGVSAFVALVAVWVIGSIVWKFVADVIASLGTGQPNGNHDDVYAHDRPRLRG